MHCPEQVSSDLVLPQMLVSANLAPQGLLQNSRFTSSRSQPRLQSERRETAVTYVRKTEVSTGMCSPVHEFFLISTVTFSLLQYLGFCLFCPFSAIIYAKSDILSTSAIYTKHSKPLINLFFLVNSFQLADSSLHLQQGPDHCSPAFLQQPHSMNSSTAASCLLTASVTFTF